MQLGRVLCGVQRDKATICFGGQRRSLPSNWGFWENEANAGRIPKNSSWRAHPWEISSTILIWSSEWVYPTSYTTGCIQRRVNFKGKRSKSWLRTDKLKRAWVHVQYRLFWHKRRMEVGACAWRAEPSTRSLSISILDSSPWWYIGSIRRILYVFSKIDLRGVYHQIHIRLGDE